MSETGFRLRVLSRSNLLNGAQLVSVELDAMPSAGQSIKLVINPSLCLPLLSTQNAKRANFYLAENTIESFDLAVAELASVDYEIVGQPMLVTGQQQLILADDSGFASAISFAQSLTLTQRKSSLVCFEFQEQLPVRLQPSQLLVDGIPPWVIASIPLLEDWRIASRVLAESVPGCFEDGLEAMLTGYFQATGFAGVVSIFGQPNWQQSVVSFLQDQPVTFSLSVQ